MGVKEAAVEKYLKQEVVKIGGVAYKFVSPSRRSVPDRLCVFPKGFHAFVECKAEGGTLTKGQVREIDRLSALDQPIVIVSSRDDVDEFIFMVQKVLKGEA